jgi:hypothetical protein
VKNLALPGKRIVCMKCGELATDFLETFIGNTRKITFFHVDPDTMDINECNTVIQRRISDSGLKVSEDLVDKPAGRGDV